MVRLPGPLDFRLVSWMRITKWKVAAIFIVVLVAVVIDGWSYVARVTSTRTSRD